MIDPLGRRTVMTYDTHGNLTSETDAQGHRVSYGYDNAGNRTKLTYPDGTLLTYEYDTNNRLIEIYDHEDDGVYEFSYDENSRR